MQFFNIKKQKGKNKELLYIYKDLSRSQNGSKKISPKTLSLYFLKFHVLNILSKILFFSMELCRLELLNFRFFPFLFACIAIHS